jgi:hypothetical protein
MQELSCNAEHAIIRNNNFDDMFFGIYFKSCNKSTATGNVIKSYGTNELLTGNGTRHSMAATDKRRTGCGSFTLFKSLINFQANA